MGSLDSDMTLKFTELIEFFERNIEHMETKVQELENDLTEASNERKQIEIFKSKIAKLSNERKQFRQELKAYKEQLKSLEMENKEFLDDLKLKNNEIENYRQKYLDALQKSEDQSCEISALKNQLAHLSDLQSANSLEMRNELMQKELAQMQNLPIELKAKQLELDETKNALKVRDNTIDALAKDLEQCLIHSEKLSSEIENERVANKKILMEIANLKTEIDKNLKEKQELVRQTEINEKQNTQIRQLEECIERNNILSQTFENQLQLLRAESAKQIVRIKERAETQRTALQSQISGLEKELAHARAALKALGKERDDTRSRMKLEVLRLERKFNEAQMEIRNLRGNIELLKCSYTSILDNYDDLDGANDSQIGVSSIDGNAEAINKTNLL